MLKVGETGTIEFAGKKYKWKTVRIEKKHGLIHLDNEYITPAEIDDDGCIIRQIIETK